MERQTYTASGKITNVLPLQEGVSKAGKSWASQSFVIEVPDDKYPTHLCFELFGRDRVQNNPVNIGDEVTVSFNPESREWNGRWFTSLRAWKVEKLGAAPQDAPQAGQPAQEDQVLTFEQSSAQVAQNPMVSQMQAEAEEDFGDLPF